MPDIRRLRKRKRQPDYIELNDYAPKQRRYDLPILQAYRGKDNRLWVWCEYCWKWHRHGNKPGKYGAGCKTKTPHKSTGYILMDAGRQSKRESPIPPEKRVSGRITGFVYFIKCNDVHGFIKIGYSDKSFEMRLDELQVGNPYKLTIIAQMPGSKKIEREIHKEFVSDRAIREWFWPSDRIIGYAASRNKLER